MIRLSLLQIKGKSDHLLPNPKDQRDLSQPCAERTGVGPQNGGSSWV